ncbi:LLM class flavin-dependent oxidoreductase [Roseovarius pelagicus]|uniref:LLM class flavin-dependent oxidoreductase n=1 Tax=Roseovarius pelagicus TaxID=2980108 RepID=A0ABY6D6G8_9RHOB|nr:LLM class flavin-dependent oxidoreductase [Roseovarius pelagicus]UXX81504.1 LLM class flavin-dependent oxidoreductase [Roseovarius pelagicus]
MDFCIQLGPYITDKSYGGDRVFKDMLDQAVFAEKLNFDSVSVTEHHLVNILMMPAPLQFATQIAQHTDQIKIITSIAVLPLHDMRVYAGEVVCADIFTQGRLLLGVGRGAFAYEMERMGVPMDQTQARFNESLDLLQKLLSEEEVSADGDYYQFDPITIMPRPMTPGGPQMMMAVLNPEGIYQCTKRGFHIQTTPLAGRHQLLRDQVAGFCRAKDEMGDAGAELTLSLSRLGFVCNSDAVRNSCIHRANSYYARFDNVFTGPGKVDNGLIRELPRNQTAEELAESLMIGSVQEIVDKLGEYSDLGIDRFIFNCNFGMSQAATLENIQQFAEEIAPHFSYKGIGVLEGACE